MEVEGHRIRAGPLLERRFQPGAVLAGDNSEAGFERIIGGLPIKYDQGDDWVRVGPLKIGIDGGALYGTAVMREPYPASSHELYGITDPAYAGEFGRGAGLNAEGVKNYVRVGNRLGWQLSSVNSVRGALNNFAKECQQPPMLIPDGFDEHRFVDAGGEEQRTRRTRWTINPNYRGPR